MKSDSHVLWYDKPARAWTQALPLGNGLLGALVWGDLYPFPAARLTALAASARKVVNVEQNSTGQLARLIRQETGLACSASILRYDGRQLSGDQIAGRILKEVSE